MKFEFKIEMCIASFCNTKKDKDEIFQSIREDV